MDTRIQHLFESVSASPHVKMSKLHSRNKPNAFGLCSCTVSNSPTPTSETFHVCDFEFQHACCLKFYYRGGLLFCSSWHHYHLWSVKDFSSVYLQEGERGLSGNKDSVFHELRGNAFLTLQGQRSLPLSPLL